MKRVTFKCEDCPKEFLAKQVLEIYLQQRRTYKGKNKTSTKCDSCTRNFSTKVLLHKDKKENYCQKIIICENFALLTGFFLYRCYYPHCSRDALSLLCGFFLYNNQQLKNF